ncbi:hypothetical protein [Alkalicoccus saliphilus]|uniref:Uncharacterized protein n=1 Tax=Alkalicoccus saliphilus TaxID=200989 RepID=A0A2T4U2C6_9BACI|nr:hypothetical protein [Alkalicoccus saliphilus]PTL37548.1 hypothetical protein C6Y45_15885 [Alkalicoccus saliphilus]
MSMAFGYFSKAVTPEKFFETVAGILYRKMKDFVYEVDAGQSFLNGSFYIVVQGGKERYKLNLTREKSLELQNKAPYALENFLWGELEKQGLPAHKFQ